MIVRKSKIYLVTDECNNEVHRLCLTNAQIKVFEYLNTCGYRFTMKEEGEAINLAGDEC